MLPIELRKQLGIRLNNDQIVSVFDTGLVAFLNSGAGTSPSFNMREDWDALYATEEGFRERLSRQAGTQAVDEFDRHMESFSGTTRTKVAGLIRWSFLPLMDEISQKYFRKSQRNLLIKEACLADLASYSFGEAQSIPDDNVSLAFARTMQLNHRGLAPHGIRRLVATEYKIRLVRSLLVRRILEDQFDFPDIQLSEITDAFRVVSQSHHRLVMYVARSSAQDPDYLESKGRSLLDLRMVSTDEILHSIENGNLSEAIAKCRLNKGK